MGTVLEYFEIIPRRILVFDAKYRHLNKIHHSDITKHLGSRCTCGINGQLNCAITDAQEYTDDYLNQINGTTTEDGYHVQCRGSCLSKDFCKNATHSAVIRDSIADQFAYSITLPDGRTGAIPTWSMLLRLFCDAVTLDALDPTTTNYPKNTLCNWASSNQGYVFTNFQSDQDGSMPPQYVVMTSRGKEISYMQNPWGAAVFPILELDADE